jgi:hypothetical protein
MQKRKPEKDFRAGLFNNRLSLASVQFTRFRAGQSALGVGPSEHWEFPTLG